MKVTLKSLKQVPYEITLQTGEETVAELKKQAENLHGFDSNTLKLVFNGMVLKDEEKISTYKIVEGCVIIMMSAKAKPVNAQPNQPKEESKSQDTVNQQPPVNLSQPVPNLQNTQNQAQNQPVQQNKPKQNKDYSAELKTLEEMGFPKTESEAAIKAARGNVSIAIEFLYNGIPDNLPPEEEVVEGGSSEQGGTSPSQLVRRIASIIKVMCANDPSQLQNIIMNIQQSQPELIEMIKQHEDEFKAVISQPVSQDDLQAFQQYRSQMNLGQEGVGGGGQEQRNVIKLSQTEYESIQRLKEFGFSEMEAAQAFFACDKNEEYALNFLFENKAQEGCK